jgi:hypothetical protein
VSIPGFTADRILYGPQDAATRHSTSVQFKPVASRAAIIPNQINGVFRSCYCGITRGFDCQIDGNNGIGLGYWDSYDCNTLNDNLCGTRCLTLLTNR